MVLTVFCVLLVSGQPAAAQPEADVDSVISRLEREQVVRLPGALTSVDAGRLAADDRVVLAPPAGLPDDLDPLWAWAKGTGVRLTVVEGWWISQEGETVRVERDELPWVLASGDVTNIIVDVPAPTPQQVTITPALLDGLRPEQVEDGWRTDQFDTGVRLLTFPMRPDPVTGYAAAVAERFPGETVIVAYGAWLEIVGAEAEEAINARDAIYGLMLLRRGSTLGPVATDLVTAVMDRKARPDPGGFYSPPRENESQANLYLVFALMIVAVGVWSLNRHGRAAAVGPMRMAWAKAHLLALRLETRLADAPDPDMARHATPEGESTGPVEPSRVRPGRPVGKRNRKKERQRPPREPMAPEPTARPLGIAALGIGVVLAGLFAHVSWLIIRTADPTDLDDYTPQNAASHLQYSSVYTHPGYTFDPSFKIGEADDLIGGRPLVVVDGFPAMCTEIARELPGVIVVVIAIYPDTDTPIVDCAHKDSFYDPAVIQDVRATTAYLPTDGDRTAFVAEYVRVFEERHPSLRRIPVDNRDLTEVLVEDLIPPVVLLVALGLTIFGAIALHRTWHITNTRLNQLADLIRNDTRPNPHKRAATADEYLRTLQAFESATNKEQRATTKQLLTTLEQAITNQQIRHR